jgi:hypothetical protein
MDPTDTVKAWTWLQRVMPSASLVFCVMYHIIALPSFLINYFGQKRIDKIGNYYLLLKTDRQNKYFRPKEAQYRHITGYNEKQIAETDF